MNPGPYRYHKGRCFLAFCEFSHGKIFIYVFPFWPGRLNRALKRLARLRRERSENENGRIFSAFSAYLVLCGTHARLYQKGAGLGHPEPGEPGGPVLNPVKDLTDAHPVKKWLT